MSEEQSNPKPIPTTGSEQDRKIFSPEEAKATLEKIEATVFFEKVLTNSDAGGSGRIVIPKGVAESGFPPLDQQAGIAMLFKDVFGGKHKIRFRFWINNSSRMYLIEGTQPLLNALKCNIGHVLMFAKLKDGGIIMCGRQGTKDDVGRKSRKGTATVAAATDRAKRANLARRAAGNLEGMKSKKSKTKEVAEGKTHSFWAALSLPARTDGVFRALPNPEAYVGLEKGKVESQHGCWTAIVSLGGELYQAFFDSQEAAQAAYDAAVQNQGYKGAPIAVASHSHKENGGPSGEQAAEAGPSGTPAAAAAPVAAATVQ